MTQRPNLVPELSCIDLARSLDFHVGLIGFEMLYDRPEDRFAYLSMPDGIELMLTQTKGQRGHEAGVGWNTARLDHPFGRGINLQIEISGVDALYARLLAHPWPIFLELHDEWYRAGSDEVGNRQFIVLDPDGYQLRFYSGLGRRPARR